MTIEIPQKITAFDLDFSRLSQNHTIQAFHCTDEDLNNFLVENALEDQKAGISVTWIATYKTKIAGYITLTTDSISKEDVVQKEEYTYPKYPAIKIARLATHEEYKNRGIGKAMIAWAQAISMKISLEYAGCRIITVDSKPGVTGYYKHLGFQETKRDHKRRNIPMYKDNMR